jgi:hypothetical protein
MSLSVLNRNKAGGWVLVGGAAVCTVLFLGEAVAAAQALRAKSWPTVIGTVVESRAVIGCGKGSSYYPFVRYKYAYESHEYEGHRLAFGNVGCGTEQRAQEAASAYFPGQSVRVWLKATSPSEAVLMVGNVLPESWLTMVITPIFVIGGFAMGRSMLKQADAA